MRGWKKRDWQWRQIAAVCTVAALLGGISMTGCQTSDSQGEDVQEEGIQDPQDRTGQEKTISPAETLQLTTEEYPVVDGSTATIPLSEAFASSVMHLPLEEVRQYIMHNTTHNAYVNLIDGTADIIFVTSPSADEMSYAEDKGVELSVVPIVSEGFVFLTSQENPIDGLTLQQIQDIYKGKITNWNQVGGQNQPVIAYQRPDNSGSQTGMYELVVPADEIADAPTEKKPQGMGELVDAVADFESGPGAIGYSYYYYVTDMWINEGIKLLAVNGVKPSAQTISDGSYPIQTAYYAVTRSDLPEDSSAAKLLAWILSEEGQKVAQEAGYVKLGAQR